MGEDLCRGIWRGKTTPKGKDREFDNIWVKGNLIQSKGLYYIHPLANVVNVQNELGRLIAMHEVDPKTLGECTGFIDKNDMLAFEGDLIKNHLCNVIGVIRRGKYKNPFNDDQFAKHIGFYVDWLVENNNYYRKDLGYWLSLSEIIGNVSDNPELLKKEKK